MIDNIRWISTLIGPVENSLLLNNVKKYEAKMKKMMTEKKIKLSKKSSARTHRGTNTHRIITYFHLLQRYAKPKCFCESAIKQVYFFASGFNS